MTKRTVFLMITLILALGSLGVLTAGAADQSANNTSALRQQEGAAWLGVSVRDSDDGVVIGTVVSESPAESAGLERGDLIEMVDDTAIESAAQLVEVIAAYQPGDEIVLTTTRDGESSEYTITLGTRPADTANRPGEERSRFQGSLNLLGLEAELTSEGLLIQSIDEGSPLAVSGLQEGDLITEVNGEAWEDLISRGMMQLFRSDEPLTFTVMRGDETLEIVVDLSDLMPMMPDVSVEPPGLFGQGVIAGQPSQLGVSFRSLDAEIAEEEGLTVTEGALIQEVFEDTPAAEAGLEVGDVITAVNDEAVDEEHTLRDRLVAYEEGDVVTLAVLRGSVTLEIEVTLGSNAGGYGQGFGGMYGRMGQGEGGPMFFYMMPGDVQGFMEQHPFMQEFFQGQPFFMGPHGEFRFDIVPAPDEPDTQEAPAPETPNTSSTPA